MYLWKNIAIALNQLVGIGTVHVCQVARDKLWLNFEDDTSIFTAAKVWSAHQKLCNQHFIVDEAKQAEQTWSVN